jgi:hypothetical protein
MEYRVSIIRNNSEGKSVVRNVSLALSCEPDALNRYVFFGLKQRGVLSRDEQIQLIDGKWSRGQNSCKLIGKTIEVNAKAKA